jgi:hypothetical protein
MSFKNLAIDRNKITAALQSYSEEATVSGPDGDGLNKKFTVVVPGQPPALVLAFYKKDGSTTISAKSGQNQNLSLELAELIKEKCAGRETNRGFLSLKNISADYFKDIIDFLCEECGATVDPEIEIPHGKQYKVHGQQGDLLTFNYYDKGSLTIQGKPLLLYSEAIEILCELLPYKDIVDSQLATIDANISAAEVTDDLEAALPNSHAFLGNKLNAIIAPSFAYLKLRIELTDYTSLVFPVLKGLEGYLNPCLTPSEISIGISRTYNEKKFGVALHFVFCALSTQFLTFQDNS